MTENHAARSISMEDKINRILENTDATRLDLAQYQQSNDLRVTQLEATVKNLEDRLFFCESKMQSVNERATTPSVIEVELAKQQAIKMHVCISGIPLTTNENPLHLAKAVFAAIGMNAACDDIVTAYRTKPSKLSSGLVVVKLASFETKLEIMAAKKRKAKLNISHLNRGFKGTSQIFINNHLTPYFATMFFRTKLAISEGLLSSRWLCNQGINVRLHDDSVHTIKSVEELDALVADIEPVQSQSETSIAASDEHETVTSDIEAQPIQSTSAGVSKPQKKRKAINLDDDSHNTPGKVKRGKNISGRALTPTAKSKKKLAITSATTT